MTRTILLAACALIAACSGGASEATTAPAARKAAPAPAAAARASAAPAAGKASTVEEATSLYEFDYSYPGEAARIPALRAALDAERDKLRRELVEEATGGRDQAREAGFDYHPYATGVGWQKVTETPRFLSLSAQVYSFTGGAHPNHGFDSLVWDKTADARLDPVAVFASAAAFDGAVQQRFCAALDKQRGERRGEPVNRASGDPFDACIAPSEQTVILGSSNGRTIDRVGILVAPYAAGPYVEGDYEVTVPVDRALLAAVRPAYREAFAAGR
ncbi:MAG: DUF4163 domain-containing protein [Rhizorhabdus sp.]